MMNIKNHKNVQPMTLTLKLGFILLLIYSYERILKTTAVNEKD